MEKKNIIVEKKNRKKLQALRERKIQERREKKK